MPHPAPRIAWTSGYTRTEHPTQEDAQREIDAFRQAGPNHNLTYTRGFAAAALEAAGSARRRLVAGQKYHCPGVSNRKLWLFSFGRARQLRQLAETILEARHHGTA